MTINKDCFITDIQTEVDNITSSSNKEEFMKTALSSCGVSDNVQSFVATGDELPDLFVDPVPDGSIFYVDSLGTPVYSYSCEWYGIDGRLFRKDFPDYELYAWGENTFGQAGNETVINASSPVQEISSSLDWCQVSAGNDHNSGIKSSGTLWTWGRNYNGFLGDGTIICKSSPVQEASSSTDWCQVSASREHSIALKTDGTLWAWGANRPFVNCGVLGDGTTIDRSSPVQEASSSTDWCQLSSNGFHSLALKNSGSLWAWGCNPSGQLGIGETFDISSPVQEVSSSTDWCQVSGGGFHSLALKTNGTLWVWGSNFRGQLGDNTTIDKCSPVQEVSSSTDWCQVSGGDGHSVALKTSGTLWSWGDDSRGQIGDGSLLINRSSPVQEAKFSTLWCQISAGSNHTIALTTSGCYAGWGCNSLGQLGDGTTTNRNVIFGYTSGGWFQVSAGFANTLAIKQVE